VDIKQVKTNSDFYLKLNITELFKILVFILNWRCWLNPAMGGAKVFTYEVAKRWVRAWHELLQWLSETAYISLTKARG